MDAFDVICLLQDSMYSVILTFLMHSFLQIPFGVVVSIPAFHAGDWGSIPHRGTIILPERSKNNEIQFWGILIFNKFSHIYYLHKSGTSSANLSTVTIHHMRKAVPYKLAYNVVIIAFVFGEIRKFMDSPRHLLYK